jgi:hypothetical protein
VNTVVQVFLPRIAITNKIADFADLAVGQMPDPLPEVYDLGSLRRFMSVFPWREQNVAVSRPPRSRAKQVDSEVEETRFVIIRQ